MSYKSINKFNTFIIICSTLLLIYSGYRCYHLSFTHDESYSFNHYVNSSVLDILTYHLDPIIANSHTLNTLSMKWQSSLFGNSEFILRLHSFLAHIIYLIFTYLILKESQSKFIILFGFIILNCNPYLLDFFSLARGYALSIALMMASIYYFIKYTKHKERNSLITTLTMAILAVLANFSLISFAVSLIIVIELFFIISKENLKSVLIKHIPIGLTLIILFIIYNGPIKTLMNNNQLNFGGESGLWVDTVISSICVYLCSSPYFDYLIIFLRFLVVFVSLGSFVVLYKQYRTHSLNAFSYISIILFFILFASTIQHLFLKGSYFRERFALFLVPLFFFALLNIINFLINQTKTLRNTSYVFATITMLCSLSILYSSANLSYSHAWKYDANTKDMLIDLEKEKSDTKKITLGITWLFEPTINFYRDTKSLTWLEYVNRDGLSGNYDYYYVEQGELTSFDKSNKVLVKTYPISGGWLYRKIK